MSVMSSPSSVCSAPPQSSHKMSTDLNKIKDSVGMIRFRCSRVMPHFSNVNWSLNKWFYSEMEHVLLLCDGVDDVVTRLDLKEKEVADAAAAAQVAEVMSPEVKKELLAAYDGDDVVGISVGVGGAGADEVHGDDGVEGGGGVSQGGADVEAVGGPEDAGDGAVMQAEEVDVVSGKEGEKRALKRKLF